MKIYEVWDEGFQKPFYLNVSKYTLAYVLEEVNKTISPRSLIFALAKIAHKKIPRGYFSIRSLFFWPEANQNWFE